MFNNNPFSNLAEVVSPLAMQGFVVAMIILVAVGTLIDIIHKIIAIIAIHMHCLHYSS